MFGAFFKTGFLCGYGACPGTSSCRPGRPQNQSSTSLCLQSARIKGLHTNASHVLMTSKAMTVMFWTLLRLYSQTKTIFINPTCSQMSSHLILLCLWVSHNLWKKLKHNYNMISLFHTTFFSPSYSGENNYPPTFALFKLYQVTTILRKCDNSKKMNLLPNIKF